MAETISIWCYKYPWSMLTDALFILKALEDCDTPAPECFGLRRRHDVEVGGLVATRDQGPATVHVRSRV
jgi:hypothetical protein